MTLHFTSGTNTAANASAYQVTGGEWASGTIQWSNKPAADISLQENISHNNVTGYVFSCLTAVQHWYDGDTTGQNENYGIMLRYYKESTADYNAVYSADYSDATKRPSLTIYYQPATNEVGMLVGQTRTLTVPDYEGTITWTSSNPAVATVSSSGVVTSVKVGATTVTAYGGGNELKRFNVYVKIQDGVYYIKNTSFGLYLGTKGGVTEQTGTSLYSKKTSGLEQLKQLWKIAYLGSGYYSIRPMYALSMGLHATSNSVDIVTVGTTDSLPGVPLSNRWKIESVSGKYIFTHTGSTALAMKATQSYGQYGISTDSYASAGEAAHWEMEQTTSVSTQVLLLDSTNGTSAANRTVYIDPGQTMTLADLQMTTSVVKLYSLNQDITWYSNSSSASVGSSTGSITGVTPGGSAVISAKHNYNGTFYEVSYQVYVKPVLEGTYYIRSRIYNRYLQTDNDDASNNYSTSGAIMEQWEFDGGDYQKWILQWRGNGYYSIISARSGKALTVPSGQTESVDISLVQQPYTGSDSQKWKITITDDHYYKIKAKSSESVSDDLVMAVGYSLINDSNGVNIEQRKYVDDDNYKDEWMLCEVGTNVFMLGVNAPETGHDHYSAYHTIMPNLYNMGYNGFNYVITDDISVEETQDYMEQCKLFVSRGHGGANEYLTAISLSKTSTEHLTSWNIYNYLSEVPVIDLSNCDLMLFVGCSTAAVEGSSLPDAAVAAGAACAIGFEESINCDDANEWTEKFFEYYSQGYSIQASAQNAADAVGENNAVQSFRIVN